MTQFEGMMMRILLFASLTPTTGMAQANFKGAMLMQEGDLHRTIVIADDYLSLTEFDIAHQKFYYTLGGPVREVGGTLTGKLEYHSADAQQVGREFRWSMQVKGKSVILIRDGREETYAVTDEGQGPLAGNWRITGRMQQNQMTTIAPSARKTVKILSGQRFQWAAIHTETGAFFGSGGGRYEFADGRYTEYIEFFSRDSSRVGSSLSFGAAVKGNEWQHTGKSSRGEPIHEVWSRRP